MTDLLARQPIIPGYVNNKLWRLSLANTGGSVVITGPLTNVEPLDARRRTLVNTQRTRAFQLRINDTNLASPSLELWEWPVGAGHYEDLYLFSDNGQEWSIQIDTASVSLVRVGDYPRLASPVLLDGAARRWTMTVSNDDILGVNDTDQTAAPSGCRLLSTDRSKVFNVTVDTNGILSVVDVDLGVQPPTFYATASEALLTSPNGTAYLLYVNNDGILFVRTADSGYAPTGDEWPLILQDRGNRLVCVDQYTARLIRGG